MLESAIGWYLLEESIQVGDSKVLHSPHKLAILSLESSVLFGQLRRGNFFVNVRLP